MLDDLPILGIAGRSGSGKTTLMEALLPRLAARGLAVAVAKFHAHGIDVDRPGKDSDRLFRAGADVYLAGPDQAFTRLHPAGAIAPAVRLADLAARYDLVLVEGRETLACRKVWLLADGETRPPAAAGDPVACLRRDADRLAAVSDLLDDWLPRQWLRTPVYGCILIGGQSSRMGKPKHLLRSGQSGGKTWLERTAAHLARVAERVVIVGAGAVPQALADAMRLPDAPGLAGPMSGILAALRWAPQASWLVAACDLPDLGGEALAWLLATRRPGVWATLPRLAPGGGVEPLLAHYDFRIRAAIEDLAAAGRFSPSLLAEHPKVACPTPPDALRPAWENVNTPDDLARTRRSRRTKSRRPAT